MPEIIQRTTSEVEAYKDATAAAQGYQLAEFKRALDQVVDAQSLGVAMQEYQDRLLARTRVVLSA